MTGSERPLCDCPEPCACYAEGYAARKDMAYFEVLASLEGPPHAGDCSCQPCLLKVMAPLARTSPGIFELVEVWALEGHDYCDRTRAHPGASRGISQGAAAVPGSCQTTATKRLRRLSGILYQVVCEARQVKHAGLDRCRTEKLVQRMHISHTKKTENKQSQLLILHATFC